MVAEGGAKAVADVVDATGADMVDATSIDVVDDARGAESVGGAEEVGLVRDAEEVIDDRAMVVRWRHHHEPTTSKSYT
jgi:hypothetical protein